MTTGDYNSSFFNDVWRENMKLPKNVINLPKT
jgi:hypothetical protein